MRVTLALGAALFCLSHANLPAEEPARPGITDCQAVCNALEIVQEIYHAEDYAAAAQSASQILERFPHMRLFWVRYLKALALEHQQLFEEAAGDYERVRKDALLPVRTFEDCECSHGEARGYDAAVEASKGAKAKKANPSTYYSASTFRLGLCQVKLGRFDDAVLTFRDITEEHPESGYRLQGYVHLGNLYRQRRDWKAAQRIYKDLIRSFPETSWAHLGMMDLAECYVQQGHTDSAVKTYESLIRTASAPLAFRAQAQIRIGEIFLGNNRRKDAIRAFRAALNQYSGVPGVAVTAQEKIALAQGDHPVGASPSGPSSPSSEHKPY